jgi:hypothetical protein
VPIVEDDDDLKVDLYCGNGCSIVYLREADFLGDEDMRSVSSLLTPLREAASPFVFVYKSDLIDSNQLDAVQRKVAIEYRLPLILVG